MKEPRDQTRRPDLPKSLLKKANQVRNGVFVSKRDPLIVCYSFNKLNTFISISNRNSDPKTMNIDKYSKGFKPLVKIDKNSMRYGIQ